MILCVRGCAKPLHLVHNKLLSRRGLCISASLALTAGNQLGARQIWIWEPIVPQGLEWKGLASLELQGVRAWGLHLSHMPTIWQRNGLVTRYVRRCLR